MLTLQTGCAKPKKRNGKRSPKLNVPHGSSLSAG